MMATEFSKAFDAWMGREGSELAKQALALAFGVGVERPTVDLLMKAAWMAGGRAASQQQLDEMKILGTKP